MFNLFKKSSLDGKAVNVNNAHKTPQEKFERASNRVHGLTRKLMQIQRRPKNENTPALIEQTEKAIEEWRKKMIIAEFELKVERGEVK